MSAQGARGGSGRFWFGLSLGFLILAVILAAASPTEKTLGSLLGPIYLHIGYVVGALLLFLVSAISAIAALVTQTDGRSARAFAISREALGLAVLSWLVYVAFSMFIAAQAWGAVNWQEPRLVNAFHVLIWVGACEVLMRVVEGNGRVALTAASGLGAIALWARRGTMLHPFAPIRTSDSAAIKGYALGVLISVVISLALLLYARIREIDTAGSSSRES